MQTKSAVRPKASPNALAWWLGGLAVLALGLLVFVVVWLLSFDRTGTYENTTSVADLDGDGDLDVILHNLRHESELAAFGGTTLWINDGQGRFAPRGLGIELPPLPYLGAAGGDVDGDGDVDLLILASDRLSVLLNQGGAQGGENGAFRLNISIQPRGDTGTPGSIVLGDLNNDGQLDGFVAGCCGMFWTAQSGKQIDLPSISWEWINAWVPRGSRVSHTLNVPELDGLPVRVALGDLDGNDSLDVLAVVEAPKFGRTYNPASRVLLNDGKGQLRDSGQLLGGPGSTSVALGDLDGDGDLDAIVGTQAGAQVWMNQGGRQAGQAGVFAISGQDIPGRQAQAVFLADLNGDGSLDALLAAANQADIHWNDGQGFFTPSGPRLRYSQRHGLAIGDFNGDGRQDIFAGAYSEGYRVWAQAR